MLNQTLFMYYNSFFRNKWKRKKNENKRILTKISTELQANYRFMYGK